MAPGPVHDNALRLLSASDLTAVCQWLGIHTNPTSIRLSEALPAATMYVDLIAAVDHNRLAHIEFVRRPEPDLPRRMLAYRSRIMNRHPKATLTQHVLVLAGGTVPTTLTDGPDLTLHLHVTYLRDTDPRTLLAHPSLAPLAVLARADSSAERETLLRQSVQVLAGIPDPHRRNDLTEMAAVLAGIHLTTATIEKQLQEAGMPITFEDTHPGREISARAEARGRTEGRTGTLAALLRHTHGDDPRIDTIATALAALPENQALDAALSAPTLDHLARTHLPRN
jgi:predicted transposase YdaD